LTAVRDTTQVVKIDAKVIDEHGTDLTKHLIGSDIPGVLTRGCSRSIVSQRARSVH